MKYRIEYGSTVHSKHGLSKRVFKTSKNCNFVIFHLFGPQSPKNTPEITKLSVFVKKMPILHFLAKNG